jgi:hypothetical protein
MGPRNSSPHHQCLHVDVLNHARALGLHGSRSQSAGGGRRLGRGRWLGRGSSGSRGANNGGSAAARTAGLRGRRRRGRRRRATRANNRRRDVAALDVHAGEVPVLGGTVVGKAKHAEVPVGAVGVRRRRDWTGDLLESVGAGGVVELDGAGAEVDAVGDVVPGASDELGVPLGLATGVPVEVVVRSALRAVLHLCKVALEEVDLVLSRWGGGVGTGVLHGEVVVDLALVDRSAGLRDQLGAEHGLAVPGRGLVVGDLNALLGARVGRVLGVGVEVDVGLGGARA